MIRFLLKFTVSFLLLILSISAIAQSHYPGMFLISFTDKNQSPFSVSSPEMYLSSKAILRREKTKIAITKQDFPVNAIYIDSLKYFGAKPSFSSRWLNAVLVRMDDSLKMQALLKVSFVDSMQYLAPVKSSKKKKIKKSKQRIKKVETAMMFAPSDQISYGSSQEQLSLIGLTALHELTLGEGIQIAVLDNGFSGMKTMSVFASLFDNGQVLGTKEIANPMGDVFAAGSHGTYVMTTMAAFEPDVLVGSAPAASYWLIHTEDNDYEYPIEEFNWAVGAEFADSVGVDIITSSLIYSTFDDPKLNHTHDQLDGKTAIISRAAQMATEKGILVFNSAGNDALKPWHVIAFPADAKDVMTVGAVDINGKYALFSSLGLSKNLPIKPNVVAVGEGVKSMSPNSGKIVAINGTSFSNPTIAGATAILLKLNPTASPSEIRKAIEESASQSLKPDSILGYGIPNYYLAHILLNKDDMDGFKMVNGFTAMPNPFLTDFQIVYNLTDSQKVRLQLFDIAGKLLFEENNLPNSVGLNIKRVRATESLSQGLFIVVLHIGDEKFSRKIVKK